MRKYHSTMHRAVRAAIAAGYTVQFDVGASGDWGWGSRLYYKKPDAKLNEYGVPLEHCDVSKVDVRCFCATVFGSPEGLHDV